MDMDFLLLIFLIHVNTQCGIFAENAIQNIASNSRTMSTESPLIYSNSKENWTYAVEFCSKNNLRMITKEDLVGTLKDDKIHSGNDVWLGSYKARTKYITDLGCFELKTEVVNLSFYNITESGMTIPRCFFYCIPHKNITINLFLLRGTTCHCVEDAGFITDMNITLGCLNLCADQEGICGGNGTYSVYKIEHELVVDRNKGFCRQTGKPFNDSRPTGCDRKTHYICKQKTADGKIEYHPSSGNSTWKTARDNCKNKDTLDSRFSQVALEDFLPGPIPYTNKNHQYWLSTRVFTIDLNAADTLVEWNYLYLCDVWNSTKRNRSQVACSRGNKIICIRDMSPTLYTVSQSMDLSLANSGTTQDDGIQINTAGIIKSNDSKQMLGEESNNIMWYILGAAAIVITVAVLIVLAFITKIHCKKNRRSKTDGNHGVQKEPMLNSNPTMPHINEEREDENYEVVREDSMQMNTLHSDRPLSERQKIAENTYDDSATENTEYSKALNKSKLSVSDYDHNNGDYDEASKITDHVLDSEYAISSHHIKDITIREEIISTDNLYDAAESEYSSSTFRKNEKEDKQTDQTYDISSRDNHSKYDDINISLLGKATPASLYDTCQSRGENS